MKTLKINIAIVFSKAWVGFLGLGFSVDGVWGLGVGPLGFIGVRDLCVNIEE